VWALAANALIFAVVSALDRRRTAG
jgi:hypothetical protein